MAFKLDTEELTFELLDDFGMSVAKLNYTSLFKCYYIYKRKLQNGSLKLQDFIK